MKTVSIKHTYWDIAADIYFPDDFNSEKSILPLSVPIQLEAAKNRHRVVCMVPPWQKLALSSLLLMPVSGKQRWRTALSGRSNNASKRLQHCR